MNKTCFITTHQKNDVVDKSVHTNIIKWLFRQWCVDNSCQQKQKHNQIPNDIITVILPYLARITTNYMPLQQFAKTFPSEFESIKTYCGKRLYKEYSRLIKRGYDTEAIKSIMIDPNNVRDIRLLMKGAPDSPFEGGLFVLQLFMRKEYPMKPPRVLFRSKIYHPNVDKYGRISLDVTSYKWAPGLTIHHVALSLYIYIQDPNPDYPLDHNVAHVWKSDIKKAHEIAKEWTKKYADGIGLMDKEIMKYNCQKQKDELEAQQS